MKQTAVEWLLNQYLTLGTLSKSIVEQAKEMEKEQIMEFAMKFMMQDRPIVSFYNEQFKSEQDETGS